MSQSVRAPVLVIGAGLAGCEAAWQIARQGVPVELADMKPSRFSPAHHSPLPAELVCSNSLKSDRISTAAGLLKAELRLLNSLLLDCAGHCRVPAGGALAVDRELFSRFVTDRLDSHPLICRYTRLYEAVPDHPIVVIATGPLTDAALLRSIASTFPVAQLRFFDAAAPLIEHDSINPTIVFRQSRYGHGDDDYWNCPFTQSEYEAFWKALITARTAAVHGFDQATVFEGCIPIETMAARGLDTLRFGPLKPVGLIDPRTGRRPYAVAQMRQDDQASRLYGLVGFQTRLAFPEQQRVFRLIPGLEQAEFARYGAMHQNAFLDSPRLLNPDLSVRMQPSVYFAGQITGVEGYVESIATGLIAGLQAAWQAHGISPSKRMAALPGSTSIIGSLLRYISNPQVSEFQPMNANFGILPELAEPVQNKTARRQALAEHSLAGIRQLVYNQAKMFSVKADAGGF